MKPRRTPFRDSIDVLAGRFAEGLLQAVLDAVRSEFAGSAPAPAARPPRGPAPVGHAPSGRPSKRIKPAAGKPRQPAAARSPEPAEIHPGTEIVDPMVVLGALPEQPTKRSARTNAAERFPQSTPVERVAPVAPIRRRRGAYVVVVADAGKQAERP